MKIVILMLSCCAVMSQPFTTRDIPFMAQGATPLTIRFLTNLSTTVDSTVNATPAFTPSSNALIVVNAAIGITGGFLTAITNTGTTNLSWLGLSTNIAGVMNHTLCISQLPIGTAPFSMTVVFASSTTALGAEIHVYEITNANTSGLWGTNSIVQAKQVGAVTANPYQLTFTNSSTSGTVFVVGAGINSSSSLTAIESPWLLSLDTGHTTTSQRLETFVRTNVPGGLTGVYLTNASVVSFYPSYIEIRR